LLSINKRGREAMMHLLMMPEVQKILEIPMQKVMMMKLKRINKEKLQDLVG